MVYLTCIICAIVLAWGIAMCGKNIGMGIVRLADAIKKMEEK